MSRDMANPIHACARRPGRLAAATSDRRVSSRCSCRMPGAPTERIRSPPPAGQSGTPRRCRTCVRTRIPASLCRSTRCSGPAG